MICTSPSQNLFLQLVKSVYKIITIYIHVGKKLLYLYLCACVSEAKKEITWKVIEVDTTKSHLATVSLKSYIVMNCFF